MVLAKGWSKVDKLELVQMALREIGDASAQELASFIEKKHGVRMEPKFIPLYKACIRDKWRLEAARQAARGTDEQGKAQAPAT
jgi:hypothetical protein